MSISDYIFEKGGLNKLPEVGNSEYSMANSGGVEVEVGEFLYGMVRLLKPQTILETGTHKGISSAYMGMALKENRKGRIDTIEFDSNHWQEAENLWGTIGVFDCINLIKKRVEYSDITMNYEMIFLDSEPELRWKELERFYSNLLPGGFVFLHDLPRGFCKGNINSDHPNFQDWPWGPVPEQVKEWMRTGELKEWHFPNPREMTGFYKKHPGDYEL